MIPSRKGGVLRHNFLGTSVPTCVPVAVLLVVVGNRLSVLVFISGLFGVFGHFWRAFNLVRPSTFGTGRKRRDPSFGWGTGGGC